MRDTLPMPNDTWALFLDVDGTLLDIAATPDAVVVPEALGDLLAALQYALEGALALVSGRPIAELDRLFAPLVLPAAGQHGAEMRLGPREPVRRRGGMPDIAPVAARLEAFAARRGILVERKGMSVAAHYRASPEREAELRTFLEDLLRELPSGGFEILPAKMAFEVKPRSFNKRVAIETFLQVAPFGGRLPVFIGDDRTDEDGFAAVRAHGGHAIRVGTTPTPGIFWTVASPQALRAWLTRVAATLGADRQLRHAQLPHAGPRRA